MKHTITAVSETGWSREEFVTRGSDPTVVVSWSKGTTKITEFQGIYSCIIDGHNYGELMLAKELHHQLENNYQDLLQAQYEAEAEMFPDGHPDDKIYGGA